MSTTAGWDAMQAPAVARSLMLLCCSVLLLYGYREVVPSSQRNEHNDCKEKLRSQLNQLAVRDGQGRNVFQMPVLLQWCWRFRRNELKAASEQSFHSYLKGLRSARRALHLQGPASPNPGKREPGRRISKLQKELVGGKCSTYATAPPRRYLP